jgi:ParB-like chromosome segregation protein Spo0J
MKRTAAKPVPRQQKGQKVKKPRINPVAEIFPQMDGLEYEQFKDDLKKHGKLRMPIIVHPEDGSIIDGRQRYRACKELGIEPSFEKWDGKGDLIDFVVGMNLARRHLSLDQKAVIAIEILPKYREEAKERQRNHGGTAPGRSKTLPQNLEGVFEKQGEAAELVARMLGISKDTVYKALKLWKEAPELYKQVEAGKKTLNEALTEAKAKKGHNAALEKLEKGFKAFRNGIHSVSGIELTKQDWKTVNGLIGETIALINTYLEENKK